MFEGLMARACVRLTKAMVMDEKFKQSYVLDTTSLRPRQGPPQILVRGCIRSCCNKQHLHTQQHRPCDPEGHRNQLIISVLPDREGHRLVLLWRPAGLCLGRHGSWL